MFSLKIKVFSVIFEFVIINWYDGGCYKVQTPDFSVVIDPESSGSGNRLKGDLTIRTSSKLGADNISINNVVEDEISGPGEYEIAGVTVRGVGVSGGEGEIRSVYKVIIDGISFGVLGNIDFELKEDALDMLSDIDILFVPSNGVTGKLVKSIEPKIVIPGWGDPKKAMIDIGQKPDPEEKLVIKKKDIEEMEGTKLVILEK